MGSNPIWSTMALDDEAIIQDFKDKAAEFSRVMGLFLGAFAENFANLRRDVSEIIDRESEKDQT